MKSLFILVLTLSVLNVYAQPPTTLDLLYGTKAFFNSFENINQVQSFEFGKPIQSIGLSMTGHLDMNRTIGLEGQYGYNYMIPQTINTDSGFAKLSGYLVNICFGKEFFKEKNAFSTILAAGFNTGRLKLKSSAADWKFKNAFFAPKISLISRVFIKKISLGLRVEASGDITSGKWKSKDKHPGFTFQKFNQSGVMGYFMLGYALY